MHKDRCSDGAKDQFMPSTHYTWPIRGPAAALYFLLKRYYAALRNIVLLIL